MRSDIRLREYTSTTTRSIIMKIWTLASSTLASSVSVVSSKVLYLTVQSTSDVDGGRPNALLRDKAEISRCCQKAVKTAPRRAAFEVGIFGIVSYLINWSVTRMLFQIRSRTSLMVSPKDAFTSVRCMPIAYAARAAKAGAR